MNFQENVWLCGANKILVDVFLFYSTWLVVGLTVKRLLVIGCPMKFSFKCSVKRAKRVVYFIGLTSFSIACLKLKYSGRYVICSSLIETWLEEKMRPIDFYILFQANFHFKISEFWQLLACRRSEKKNLFDETKKKKNWKFYDVSR